MPRLSDEELEAIRKDDGGIVWGIVEARVAHHPDLKLDVVTKKLMAAALTCLAKRSDHVFVPTSPLELLVLLRECDRLRAQLKLADEWLHTGLHTSNIDLTNGTKCNCCVAREAYRAARKGGE